LGGSQHFVSFGNPSLLGPIMHSKIFFSKTACGMKKLLIEVSYYDLEKGNDKIIHKYEFHKKGFVCPKKQNLSITQKKKIHSSVEMGRL
jgi:hypothetical protein